MGMDYSLVQRIIDGLGKILDTKPGSPDEGTYVTEQQLADWIKGQTFVTGYYHNGAFYSDLAHTTLITPQANVLYADLGAYGLYAWDGAAYQPFTPDLSPYATKAEMQAADTALQAQLDRDNARLQNLEQAKGDYVVSNYKDGAITPSGKGAWSIVEGVRGVSRVENNLVAPSNLRTREAYGVTITANEDGTITVSGTAEASTNLDFTLNNFGTVGHSYVVCGGKSSGNIAINDGTHIVTDSGAGAYLANATGTVKLQFPITNGVNYNVTVTPCVTDLNVYFNTSDLSFLGATDSAKLATIQTNYPHLLLPSEYGTRIVDAEYTGVRSWGVNLIDASNLVADSYVDSITGIIGVYSGVKRTDYMRVKGGESYFFGGYITANKGNTGAYFDINKNYLGAILNDSDARPFVAPANCAYVVMNFWLNNWGDLATTAYFVPYDLPHKWSPYMENTLSLTYTGKSAGSVAERYFPETGEQTHPLRRMTFDDDTYWQRSNDGVYFTTDVSGLYNESILPFCPPYVAVSNAGGNTDAYNKGNMTCCFRRTTTDRFYIRDDYAFVTMNYTANEFKEYIKGKTLTFALATPDPSTFVTPIIDNTLLTEAYGRMSTVQTGTVVDGSFDMGFITL